MSFAEDREELLNHILSEMMNDEWKFHYYNRNQKIPSHLEVDCDSFEKRVSVIWDGWGV